MAEALSALDLVVFPSLWEGTPLTVLETLAMGKPIVSTDADGLQDVLTNGQTRSWCRGATRRCSAGAIIWLANSPAERVRLASNAKVTGARYDIALFVRKMERLYELLHETSRATRRAGILEADLSFLGSGASAT